MGAGARSRSADAERRTSRWAVQFWRPGHTVLVPSYVIASTAGTRDRGCGYNSWCRGVMSVQRKSFVFPQDVSERLERLTSSTRLESNSSVVRLALVVLEDLVEAIAKGEKITIEDEAGQA